MANINNIALAPLTALSVMFYSEITDFLRFQGSTAVGGEMIENVRLVVSMKAVIRDTNTEELKKNFPELEYTEGMIQIHTKSEVYAQEGIIRGSSDQLMVDGNLFTIVEVNNSSTHGGFYRSIASKRRNVN